EYLRLVPDDPEALHWMGRVLQDKKDLGQAIVYYRRALEKSPERVDSLNSLGLAYREQGDFEQSVVCCEQALKYQPNDFVVLNNMGETFKKLLKFDKAISCFKQALSARPGYYMALNNLGIVLKEEGKLEEAAENFKKALSAKPDYPEAHYNLGLVLQKQGMFEDAAYYLQLALSFKPEYPDVYALLGRIDLVKGDFNNAKANCQKALSINPQNLLALILMLTMQKGADDKDHLSKMENLLLKEDLKNEHKIELAFALGKAYEDLGDYDKSFSYTSEGNKLMRGSYEYSIQEDKQLFNLIKKVYHKSHVLKHTSEGNADNSPIFILGMPRSGTSLVEQILASHPDVYGAGELEDFQQVALKLTGGKSRVEIFEKISQSGDDFYAKLAVEYLQRLRKHSSTAKFITDKLPHNFQFVGSILLALPKAKIVHCVREPMDNCFSMYKNAFGGVHNYAYDLQELGQYYLLYMGLMRHWHDIFSDRIYDIKYEDLVADQEGETRKLLKYCSLSWHDQCLSFYKTSRNVSTLSWTQVRKPIYKDSIQLWEKYREHLEPLRSILSG
ncbi:MAG: sulfotransferase, partial [Desulfobulbaceae bacterium]|nr:sulfotransferase [Desulfobulbaceae bacterium]